jgi:ELWxxDGT repeat protein
MKNKRKKILTVFKVLNHKVLTIILLFQLNICIGQKVELLKDISPIGGSQPSNLTLFKDKVYFSAIEVTNNPPFIASLWSTDGTTNGTNKIKACNPSANSSNQPFVTTNDLIFFQGKDQINGYELWVSDGTTAGTKMVKNITPTGDTRFGELISFKNKLYFSANDGVSDALWVSDGTDVGTVKIKIFSHPNIAYVKPNAFQIFDDRLFFHFDDSNGYNEFWVTDGTTLGTKLLNLNKGFGVLPAQDFKKYKDKIIFRVGKSINILEKDTFFTIGNIRGDDCLGAENHVFIFKDTIYFHTENSELWLSDGTKNGTKKIVTTQYPCRFLQANNKLFFAAKNFSPARLWTTDGSFNGTKQVAKLSDYEISEQSSHMITYKDKIYFNGFNQKSKYQIFFYDPFIDSVKILKNSFPNDIQPVRFFIVKDKLYFIGNNPNYSSDPINQPILALWKTDGSEQGTTLVKDKILTNYYNEISYLANIDSLLFFSSPANSYWFTDGTQTKTKTIKPDGLGTYYSPSDKIFITYKDNLIFRSNFTNTDANDELWILRLNNTTNLHQLTINEDNIIIYPNPTSTNFYIDGILEEEICNIEIYSLMGKLVSKYLNVKKHQSLNVSSLNEGIYFINLTTSKNKYLSKKIVISKEK